MATATVGRVSRHRLLSTIEICTPVLIVCAFTWRIFGGTAPIVRFSDDFFYYVLPAQNWVGGAGSTFFPGEPTNGYHPLWFLWISFLTLVGGHGAPFFALVDLSIMLLVIGFFVLFAKFLSKVTSNRLAGAVGASVATIPLAVISMAGVETALAAFAAALLLNHLTGQPLSERTARDAALVGLMCALLVLARLDASLLVLGLAVAVLPTWGWRRVVAAVAGGTPLYGYLAFNIVAFGHLATTSMAAKSPGLYWPPNGWFVFHPSPVAGVVVIGAVVATSAAIVAMLRNALDDGRRLVLAIAAAPLLQLAMQAALSGWSLFPWYFYLFFMALGVAAALLTAQLTHWSPRRWVAIAVGAVVSVGMVRVLIGGLTPDPWQVEIAAVAERLQVFSLDHPGVYAMGDAAGTPTWLTRTPVVQLEGLMMSHAFLDRIRQRQPLRQVFEDYGVNYYVSVRDEGTDAGGCLRFSEPNSEQASPRAPAMSATICGAPVEAFQVGPHYQVRIYRIDPTTGRPS
jgi:hypothetical protein